MALDSQSPSLVIDAAVRTRGGLQDLLLGEDPVQVERLWEKTYDGTGLWGRRGVTIAAIGAVETALWDIAGEILNRPACELIWRSFATAKEPAAIKPKVRPYATVCAGRQRTRSAAGLEWRWIAASRR